MYRWPHAVIVPLVLCLPFVAYAAAPPAVDLVEIPKGPFVMGKDAGAFPDQQPAHPVTITHAFRIGVTEITLEQFRQFRPEWPQGSSGGFVSGVSWHDAMAFCEWLSNSSGKAYRLPTEAEWEYVCRSAERWGARNMTNDVREWCYDLYGPYAPQPASDPVGADQGLERVVRGGVLDTLDGKFECVPRSEYDQPAYRAALPPAFGLDLESPAETRSGAHAIGFRVVEGALPNTMPTPAPAPFLQQGVIANTTVAKQGPDPAKPYYRKRYLLPSPPETTSYGANIAQHQYRILAAGLDPLFRGHNHSPSLEVCDNGDLLLAVFTSYTEYEPEMSLMGTRLRFGSDQWDMPSTLVDFPGVCDNTPLLWKDQGRVYLFWAWSRATGGYPFQWTASGDNGETWDAVQFPHFPGPIGPHSRQPINRALRGADGTVYLPSDAIGGSSVLWGSKDNLKTWFDTGGRSAGRHTVYATLNDGRLLAMGGKNTDIEGYMPKAVSADGGKSWQVSKSEFPALAVNQRPSLLRLQSGRLFFAADFQKEKGIRPPGATEAGSFVALSDDDGETWHFKRLPGAQEHENGPGFFRKLPGATTFGYSVARQAPNGVIHLIATMNKPCLHFEMNEAWIMAKELGDETDAVLMANTAKSIRDVRRYEERYADGSPRRVWHAGTGDDGRYLLHGKQTWYYPDGTKQYAAVYALGRKTETETLWRSDGSKAWQWKHKPDGVSRWIQWWENGVVKAESNWKNFKAIGMTRAWNRNGALAAQMNEDPEVPAP